MTAKEFIARLAPVDLERLALIFNHLGAHVPELRLENGSRLNDATDFSAFLYELGTAARFPENAAPSGRIPDPPAPRDHTCSDCGHVHEDKPECKVYLGEGRFCPCESKVAA